MDTTTLLALLLTVWVGSYVVLVRWVFRDAERRGHSGWRAVSLVSLLWPAGLFLWLMIRSDLHLAPKGWGSAWG